MRNKLSHCSGLIMMYKIINDLISPKITLPGADPGTG